MGGGTGDVADGSGCFGDEGDDLCFILGVAWHGGLSGEDERSPAGAEAGVEFADVLFEEGVMGGSAAEEDGGEVGTAFEVDFRSAEDGLNLVRGEVIDVG